MRTAERINNRAEADDNGWIAVAVWDESPLQDGYHLRPVMVVALFSGEDAVGASAAASRFISEHKAEVHRTMPQHHTLLYTTSVALEARQEDYHDDLMRLIAEYEEYTSYVGRS